MTVALALDISMTRTGWAIGGPDWDRPCWGTFETANWAKRQGYNLRNFRKFLDTRASTFKITHLVVENIFVTVLKAGAAFNFSGTEGQMMLAGVALEWAESRGIAQSKIDISDWRGHFLGHSRRPKGAAKEEQYWKNLALRRAAELGWYCEHHDEAEALGILDYSLMCLDANYRVKTGPRASRVKLDMMNSRGLFA